MCLLIGDILNSRSHIIENGMVDARDWGRMNEELLTNNQKAVEKVSTMHCIFERFRRLPDWVVT